MKPEDKDRIQAFLTKWQGSQGNERANYQGFFLDLCEALGVDRPPPKGNIPGDPYCFDKDIQVIHKDGITTNFADFYKAGHFLIEAKQGGNSSKRGTAKRGTKTYDTAMEKAFYQALSYTPFLPNKPPFVITCDIGSHFELWMSFSGNYGGYGAREKIPLDKLLDEKVFDRFVAIFSDPQSLNPEKYRAKVTREVADTLAKLARWLEEQGHEPQEASSFLMRCIFTMFAEDVDLLKGEVFTKALKERWIADPASFKPQVETLWQTMNTGGSFGFERILRFNGSFFADATAFDLPRAQLEILHEAADKDWSAVEPAIFGTLLERALDKKERSRLGAHYTPRSYVERLVRPVVMEPLREEWLLVESEVDRLLILKDNQQEPTKAQRQKAAIEIQAFLDKLQQIRILDPACGTGNFLYVTLDLLKTLEQEVQTRLLDVVGQVTTDLLEEFDPRLAGRKQVNPSQFLGIEINPRAAGIAELVIWIGYLQWHFKRYGSTPPPEPILQDFHNIEYRDAVLAYDGREEAIDPKTGRVKTRWGGRMMRHPVTGEDVPDPSDQIPIYRYINARSAEWQEADYIVSNPPFIGNAWIRERLGDGYAEAIRKSYKNVPETVDFVMYWWHKAAELIRSKKLKKFGFITTNTISQTSQRKVLELHQNNSICLTFAIPDHPWMNGDAAVRIAMTVAELDDPKTQKSARIGTVISEGDEDSPEEKAARIQLQIKNVGTIFSNLQAGTNISSVLPLKSNHELSCPGVKLHGSGFCLTPQEAINIEAEVIHPYLNGRDLLHTSRMLLAIDLFEFSEKEARTSFPRAYQWVYERVKPERDQNNRASYRANWWYFGEPRANLRPALKDLTRYIATVETSKHRVFSFLGNEVLPDNKIIVIALADAYHLGVLSSSTHVVWALASGARLEDRPVYVKTVCFDRFPFPDRTPEQEQKIRELGERLDAHRKRVQAQHPEVTITGMYNLLEKLRKGEAFSESDRAYNDKALVSTLKQIHDELDVAVLEAYGWDDLVPLLGNFPHPPAPSPTGGEGEHQSPSPALGEGFRERANQEQPIEGNFPHPPTPSPTGGEGEHQSPSPKAGEGFRERANQEQPIEGNFPHPLTPSPTGGEGGQEERANQEQPIAEQRWEISQAIKAKMTEVARQFRKESTPSEAILWQALRRQQLDGRKFRRQQPIGTFVVDFFCSSERLIVEVDGGIHESQQGRDRQRQELLESLGLRFVRVKSEQVETNLPAVLNTIRQSFTPLTPNTSPALGEVLGVRATPSTTAKDLDEIILERLVALNAERAEEERNGLIRWLRPEYQAPDEVRTQQVLAGVVEPEEALIAPVEQKPFPKQPKEQLATIRDLLRTSGGEWSIDQIAAQFKGGGRYKGAIADNLERLEWFGVLISREDGSIQRWQFAELQQAS